MIGIVLDLDGVVYRGNEAIPGAGSTLRWLADRHRLVFATNNSSRTPEAVAGKIRTITGYPADAAEVVTSAMAAASVADVEPTFVVGGEGIRRALADVGIEVVGAETAGQVVSGIDFSFSYDTMRSAASALRGGARWIATNTDATFPTEVGEWPGAGAIVAGLEAASGRTPEVAGKPHRPMVDLVSSRLSVSEVIVVGDRPETDMALANRAGWRSVLALTGVTTDPGAIPPGLAPEAIIDGLADLPNLLERLGRA